MKKSIRILSLLFCVIFSFAFCGCNKTADNVYGGWEIVEERINGVGEPLQYYASFRINTPDANRKIKDVWVNASAITDDEVTFNFAFSNSSSFLSATEKSAVATKTQLKDKNGWVKLFENAEDLSFTYVEVYVTQNMYFNEFALVSTTNKLLELTLVETGARPYRGSNSVKYKYSQNELEAKLEEGDITTSSLNLIDKKPALDMKDYENATSSASNS